jgi:hypothetical protein
VLEVILGCEREFGAVLGLDNDLAPETLSSPRRLAELIRTRVSA